MSANLSPSTGVPPADSVAGYAIILISALAFAGNNAFAVMSYEGGATPLTLITVRMIFTLGALALLMKIAGAPIALPRRERGAALALGVLNGTMAFCLMSAFDHIAVGLAILVFYLYPVLTGIGAWLTGQEALGRGLVIGLVGSFAGLALALEITGDSANAAGLLLALTAAILMAAVALLGARLLRTANARSVTLHMHISAGGMFLAVSLAFGEMSLPGTTMGWVGFWAVPLCYTVAIACFFAGMARIGAVRSSLLMNLEPVASIAFGFVLLGQILSSYQLAGATLVIASVTAVKWMGGRRA